MAAAVVAATIAIVAIWLDLLVERAIIAHAEEVTLRWRSEFTASVPDLELLFQTGDLGAKQHQIITATVAGSDIFRFLLFNTSGQVIFRSDGAITPDTVQKQHNLSAIKAVKTDMTDVTVEDGRNNPELPSWYVEAYMPIVAKTGDPLGVVEVYVDVSTLSAALRTKFSWLSIFLIITTALIYLVPTLLVIKRNDQLHQRDLSLLRLSKLDALTGLLNRGAFNDISAELFTPPRSSEQEIGIFFIDLDKFKEVNDTSGHDVGDQLLKHVGYLLNSIQRNGTTLARLGGDEFVMLVPGINSNEMHQLGEDLIGLMQKPLKSGNHEIWPSFSIGAYLSPDGEPLQRALHCADLAVYQAKANGRGQLVEFTPELERSRQRQSDVADSIRNGMANDLFFLEYQPIYDRNGQMAGCEALLRLKDKLGNVISPVEFIPVAEDVGLIEDLGLWTLRQAINAATQWPESLFVAVNVSAHEFRSGGLPAYLDMVLQDTNLAPERLCIELTECTLIDHSEAVRTQLIELKSMGIVLAIDDFGSGYSSLGYLWRYQFDRLKIDKVFLEGYCFDNDRYKKIIETIVLMGHQWDMSVTIEGVEHQHQLDDMRELGCDYFQGFLMSRPVPLEKLPLFAARRFSA